MDLGYVSGCVQRELSKFQTIKSEAKLKAKEIHNHWEGTAYDSFEDSYADIDKAMQSVCTGYSRIASKLSTLQTQIIQEEERRRRERERERAAEKRRQEQRKAAEG